MPKQEEQISAGAARLSSEERQAARLLQGDIPLLRRPFQRIGEMAGLTEIEVLSLAGGFRKRGIIRKFGAIVRHQRVGYSHNIMILWAVSPEHTEVVGKALSGFAEVTHAYERTPPFAGRYNLFTMVHFRNEADEALLRKMAEVAGVADFRILRSLEEFKKNSMEYF